jgi:hypothetical protein
VRPLNGEVRTLSRAMSILLFSLGNQSLTVDIVAVLPQLQVALPSYGATYVPQIMAPSKTQQQKEAGGAEYGSQRFPNGGGNRFGGSGGMGGYGVPAHDLDKGCKFDFSSHRGASYEVFMHRS